ncbi:MAG: YeeE/YedE family protein [Paracoccaceae bacterium]
MDLITLVDRIGDAPTAALFGLATGIMFGVAAQRSRFCLRAAVVEFAHGQIGDRMAIWLLTFSTAVVWVQSASLMGLINISDARMMAVPGSWSGAIIGGLLFGAGMVLARGCSGRLLTLAATGNLRSVVSGLIFAVVAQMTLTGWLAPLRDGLASLWITSGGRNVDLLASLGLPEFTGLLFGLAVAIFALERAQRYDIGIPRMIFASGVGFAIAVGWVLTSQLAQVAFDPIPIESATFTGPSANTLMFFLDRSAIWEFDIGLVPGVVLGSFTAAALSKELKIQGFDGSAPMRNAMIGAAMMGFGGMLAGGCAIGAGVTGGSIFAGTTWVALTAMWVGGMAAETSVRRFGAHAVAA